MLKQIVKGTMTKLEGINTIQKVEFYEGQLEDLENFLILPPHAFVGLDIGNNDTERYINLSLNIKIYLCTSHMAGDNNDSMYDLIDEVIQTLHGEYIYDSDKQIDKLFFKGFKEVGIFPGLSVFEMNFALGAIN